MIFLLYTIFLLELIFYTQNENKTKREENPIFDYTNLINCILYKKKAF